MILTRKMIIRTVVVILLIIAAIWIFSMISNAGNPAGYEDCSCIDCLPGCSCGCGCDTLPPSSPSGSLAPTS